MKGVNEMGDIRTKIDYEDAPSEIPKYKIQATKEDFLGVTSAIAHYIIRICESENPTDVEVMKLPELVKAYHEIVKFS